VKSIGMALDLKDPPGVVERYKDYHRSVWPEVKESLRNIGISKMKIFLIGRHLFMYVEVPEDFDTDRDFPKYMDAPKAKAWDELMRGFQQKLQEAKSAEWWAEMEEVFDLDW